MAIVSTHPRTSFATTANLVRGLNVHLMTVVLKYESESTRAARLGFLRKLLEGSSMEATLRFVPPLVPIPARGQMCDLIYMKYASDKETKL